MGQVSDLIKLDNISKRNGAIWAFPIPRNLVATRVGEEGWGEATIAINNATVAALAGDSLIGVLCLVSRDEWEKEKTINKSEPAAGWSCKCGCQETVKKPHQTHGYGLYCTDCGRWVKWLGKKGVVLDGSDSQPAEQAAE